MGGSNSTPCCYGYGNGNDMLTYNWTLLKNITEEKDCKVEPGMDGGGRIWFPECPESEDEAREKYLKRQETCKIDKDCEKFGFAGNKCIGEKCVIPKCSDSRTADSDLCECSGSSSDGKYCSKSKCLSSKPADGGENSCPPSDLKPYTPTPMPEYLFDDDWPKCASSEGNIACLPVKKTGKTCTEEIYKRLVGKMEKLGIEYCSSGGAESIKVAFTVLLVALLI